MAAKQPKVRITMSVLPEDAKRLGRVAAEFTARLPGSNITRAEALRAVMHLGLDAMERKLRLPSKDKPTMRPKGRRRP